jgi:hypothetical protein
VIPRLARSNPITARQPEWPEWPQSGDRSTGALFEERPALRKLVVLVDAELLASSDDPAITPITLLTGLLTHPYIKFFRYRDEGAPPDVPRREAGPPSARRRIAEGWAELQPVQANGVRGLIYADESGFVYAGLKGNLPEFARRDVNSGAYANLGLLEALDRREADAIALQVAQSIQADLFITERAYLFATRVSTQGVTVCKPAEALAMIGLYLRTQKAFLIWRDSAESFGMNQGLYYLVGTRELLPSGWRWFTACVQESHATNDDTMLELGQSVLLRAQRALEARDNLHRAFNLLQNNDTAATTLYELDSILVSLMGATDASARVAHVVLGIAGDLRDAGWQRDRRWLPQVAAAEPPLAALFSAGTPHNHTLTILRLMRNTIHGEMIRSIALQQPGRTLETAMVLPASGEAAILASMDALGGRGSWGASLKANRWLVDPAIFLEQLLPLVLTMLNEVMDKTPVERLSHVALTPADSQPPVPDPKLGGMDVFGERSRLSIRWQLGL